MGRVGLFPVTLVGDFAAFTVLLQCDGWLQLTAVKDQGSSVVSAGSSLYNPPHGVSLPAVVLTRKMRYRCWSFL